MTVGLLSQRVIGEFRLLPSSGGLNAYIGNNPEICETLTIRPGDDWGELIARPMRAGYEDQGDANRYFYREVVRYGREMPLSFLSGLGSKALRFASSRELPRNFDPYLAGEWSFVQRILTWKVGQFGFPFGLLLPLAIIGIVRSWRRIGTPALLFLSIYPASVVLIFVASRYRAPIIPVLSIVAAAGGAALLMDLQKRNWKRLAGAATIVLITGLIATLPGPFCEEQKNLHADFLYCLGHSQNERAQPDLAIASYQQALAEDPALPQVHYNLGLLFRDRRDLDAAAQHFGEAIRLDPGHVRALNNLGSVAESQGNLAEAERRFAQALGLDPKLAVAQRNLGNIRLQLGRPADALGPLRRALEIDPNDANALFLLGSSLMQTGDGQGAIASLEQATQLKSDPRFHNELGTALLGARRLDEAAAQFRIAIDLSPDWVDPYNNAGAALAMNGDILGAIEFIRRAIEIEPTFADGHYNLASLLLRLGRTDEARAELVTVLKLRPDHPQAVARLNALGDGE
jgi:tetratricopeptide (TPR) repeat protein